MTIFWGFYDSVTIVEELPSVSRQLSSGLQEPVWSEINRPGAEQEQVQSYTPVQPMSSDPVSGTLEAAYKGQIQSLTQELERAQAECALFRSHIHPPDNTAEPQTIKIL
ncbi:hypothetical protein RSAG8_07696, partial [Rhizoctonia solani AG-8 WAC10335]